LAIKAAIKASTVHEKLQKLLLDLYLFYHQSTLNRGLLRTAAAALGIKKFIPTRTGGTRWIEHTKTALENLFSGYPAIVQHLLEVCKLVNLFVCMLRARYFCQFCHVHTYVSTESMTENH
jgi:hypothetical protein